MKDQTLMALVKLPALGCGRRGDPGAAGRIRWMHVGEGNYDEAERLIQKLLAET